MIEGTVSLKCQRCNHCEVCQWVDLKMDGCDWFEEEPRTGWIPVKWHTITEEEREREGYPKEWVNHVDCVMPEDGQEILITVKGRKGNRLVEKDTNYIDDGFYLDSGYDWVEDVEAWCELPEPYKAESEG